MVVSTYTLFEIHTLSRQTGFLRLIDLPVDLPIASAAPDALNLSKTPIEPVPPESVEALEGTPIALSPEPDASMTEYYRLQQELFIVNLAFAGISFIAVWLAYSFNIALNYLLGACAGVVYLRMLAKSIEELGRQQGKLGKSRLALFIGLMVVATQWHQLHLIPIFLGFLTYKIAILVYTLRTTLMPDSWKS